MPLPNAGAVLGVDVGFSPTQRSSAVCLLSWTETELEWSIKRFRYREAEWKAALTELGTRTPLHAAAFDGPLRSGFDVIGRYRTAERVLTRGLGRVIGKPGQSSAPVGKSLNAAANTLALFVRETAVLADASHLHAIDPKAVVEAFPSSFLGVMLERPSDLTVSRGDRSDAFFQHLAAVGVLQDFAHHLLPGRHARHSWTDVTNHDDRAALVCALTALAVAQGDYTAVGDDDGWIILPPRSFVRSWAWDILAANDQAEGHVAAVNSGAPVAA